mmetsp:Transcript_6544/g.26278  ORF Transcript_6544/g.26278 Transcript_6544/m.26278 type:complete len:122 (+) Transcript_6544:1278-1643(+)
MYGEICPELQSGDVILFHGLTIHGSLDNLSNQTRLALVATMNTKKNTPIPSMNQPMHPYYTHQKRINTRIVAADRSKLPNFKFQWPLPNEDGLTYDGQGTAVRVPNRDYSFCSLYDSQMTC